MQPRLTQLASAISLLFTVSTSMAQHVENQSTSEQQLETVTVTAEHEGSFKSNSVQVGTFRDMNPLSVPQTSNVVTREVMDAQAAKTLMEVLRNTAGVTHAQINGSTYDNVAVRGILVENRGNYRLNGSLPIINLIHTPIENKERVEVLKGASSLYYGFVPPSGIINFVTKRAGKDPVTSLSLSANDHGAAMAHVDVGRRFGEHDQFGARVNLVHGTEDIGVDNYSGDRSLASAALDFRATRDLSFKLDVEHYRKDVSEQAAILFLPAQGIPSVPDNRLNLAGEWQKYDAKATNVLFRTDYLLNDTWAVLFEAGKARTERDRVFSKFWKYDLSTGEGQLNLSFNKGQEWQNENYRTELNGFIDGGWISHQLAFGYTTNTRDNTSPSLSNVDVSQNLYNPREIVPRTAPGPLSITESTITDRGWYVSDNVSFGEQWQLMIGARGSDYETRTTKNGAPTNDYEAKKVSPAAALTYKPVPSVSIYGSYIEGLEAGGQAKPGLDNAGEWLPPSVAKQKEMGVKAEVAKGVLVQAAYFDIERPSATVTDNRYVMNGMAQYKGIELAASGELTKQLSVIGSALFLDATQLNSSNPDTFGKTPENTPRRTASLFAEYRLKSVAGLAVSGGLFHVGERAVNNKNEAFVDGYTTLSLGTRYATRIAGNKTVLQAVIDNVTDKDYWSAAGSNYLGLGSPRTLKLTATMQF